MIYRTCDPPPDVARLRGAIYTANTRSLIKSLELAQDAATRWEQSEFHVAFLDGSQAQIQLVKDVLASQFCWPAFCGVTFLFEPVAAPEIRITFTPGNSWSRLGRQSGLRAEYPEPSMQLGWLTDTTDIWEAVRVVTHEFGHALGLIHEHQSPAADIPWNREAVLRHYTESLRWTPEMVEANVFGGWTASECSNYSAYDQLSIMAYWLAEDWVTDPAYAHGPNTIPSAMDRAYAAQWYGPPARKWHEVRLPFAGRA